MTLIDLFRVLTISGTAFLIGTFITTLRVLRTTKRAGPAPPWINNLFTVGAVMLAVGSAWNAWVNLGSRVFTPGRVLTTVGGIILSWATLLIGRYFAQDGD